MEPGSLIILLFVVFIVPLLIGLWYGGIPLLKQCAKATSNTNFTEHDSEISWRERAALVSWRDFFRSHASGTRTFHQTISSPKGSPQSSNKSSISPFSKRSKGSKHPNPASPQVTTDQHKMSSIPPLPKVDFNRKVSDLGTQVKSVHGSSHYMLTLQGTCCGPSRKAESKYLEVQLPVEISVAETRKQGQH